MNSVCYIIGWFWCMLWGINGYSFVALQGAVFLIALQLYYVDSRLFKSDAILAAISIPLGLLLEMLLIWAHVIRYGDSSLPPIWILAIYPLFALLVNHLFSFLKGYPIPAFFIGFIGIPSSYFWVNTHGGLTFGYSSVLTWIILGTCYGLFLNLLLKISNVKT